MIRVLVVDDDPMVRRLLGAILRTEDVEVVAEASDGDEVVPQVQAHHPDVVLMDLRMARVDGLAATRAVLALPAPPAVVAMTSLGTQAATLDAVRAGAAGFLDKDAGPDEIRGAVRAVAAGEGALSPRAARAVIAQVGADSAAEARREAAAQVDALTDREREIALAATEGLSNAAIAARLFVSEATVKTHLGHAMDKLGAANRVQLAVIVTRAGLAEP